MNSRRGKGREERVGVRDGLVGGGGLMCERNTIFTLEKKLVSILNDMRTECPPQRCKYLINQVMFFLFFVENFIKHL